MKSLRAAAVLLLVMAQPASAEWTLAGFVGASHTTETWLSVSQPDDGTDVRLSPVDYDGASFEPPIYYGYRAGFFPRSKRLGVEAEFIHVKVIADSRQIAGVLDHFSLTHGVNLLLLNFVGRYPSATSNAAPSPWMLTARVGLGGSLPHAESRLNDDSLEQYEWGGFAVQGAIGAEVRVAGALYLLGEYKLTRTSPEVAIVRGSARTSLTSHHFIFGLAVHSRQSETRPARGPYSLHDRRRRP